MARPFLADPFLLQKAAKGKPEAINTCIACNQACLDHSFQVRAQHASKQAARRLYFSHPPLTPPTHPPTLHPFYHPPTHPPSFPGEDRVLPCQPARWVRDRAQARHTDDQPYEACGCGRGACGARLLDCRRSEGP